MSHSLGIIQRLKQCKKYSIKGDIHVFLMSRNADLLIRFVFFLIVFIFYQNTLGRYLYHWHLWRHGIGASVLVLGSTIESNISGITCPISGWEPSAPANTSKLPVRPLISIVITPHIDFSSTLGRKTTGIYHHSRPLQH